MLFLWACYFSVTDKLFMRRPNYMNEIYNSNGMKYNLVYSEFVPNMQYKLV